MRCSSLAASAALRAASASMDCTSIRDCNPTSALAMSTFKSRSSSSISKTFGSVCATSAPRKASRSFSLASRSSYSSCSPLTFSAAFSISLASVSSPAPDPARFIRFTTPVNPTTISRRNGRTRDAIVLPRSCIAPSRVDRDPSSVIDCASSIPANCPSPLVRFCRAVLTSLKPTFP